MKNAEEVLNIIRNLIFGDGKDRDITLNNLYRNIEVKLIEEGFEYAWIMEMMTNVGGQYAIFSSGGKLHRANFTVDASDEVVISETFEVKVDYPKVENRTRIYRSAEWCRKTAVKQPIDSRAIEGNV